ncbi:MAG: TauD/TfdA family dioxygenase [Alphaproteobacteria bacterium]|nr:TauD/TfdA family dioxygenase [Alphaproteobacteria bacterium]
MIHRSRITEASAWEPADLTADASWHLELTDRETADLRAALDGTRQQGLRLEEINQGNFPLPHCQGVIEKIKQQLANGFGFALLRGFPIEAHEREDIAKMYWGLCCHLGLGLTQNGDGTLIHYVTEGHLRPSQGTRGVGNPGKVSLHVDLADCVSLLCIHQPPSSPQSHVASSTTIHNKLLQRDPALLERLYEGFVWDRQNEHGPSETATSAYRVPVFSQRDGFVSCRYNRNWMRRAADRQGGFSEEDTALLDTFDELANESRFAFDFEPGDIQFVNNYTILHGREPHPPATNEEEIRLLMRIWFDLDEPRPMWDEAIIRYGIIRHGRLGWTARDLITGLESKTHARRPEDLAPLIEA